MCTLFMSYPSPVVEHNNRWVKECPLYCYLWVHICFNSISYIYNIILEFGNSNYVCYVKIYCTANS